MWNTSLVSSWVLKSNERIIRESRDYLNIWRKQRGWLVSNNSWWVVPYLIWDNENKRELMWEKVFRMSHRMFSVKNGVLRNLAYFAGKHLCWNFFLVKLRTWKLASLKRESNADAFCFKEHLQMTAPKFG